MAEEGGEIHGLGLVKKLDGYWALSDLVPHIRVAQESFVGKPGDILLTSIPKTGATWLKALVHCIQSSLSGKDLLGECNPHSIVPFLESHDINEWYDLPPLRLLHTHIPIHDLPTQHDSCKIIYIIRNPRDAFVSHWKFHDRLAKEGTKGCEGHGATMDDLFDAFCKGHFHGGPFAQHVLGYLRESLANPDSVMFLTYEDLQSDCEGWISKIGSFLGYDDCVIRSKHGVIAERCSFGQLLTLDVNSGDRLVTINDYALPGSGFFRTGKSEGWKEHFTPEMVKRIHEEIEVELEKEGLFFSY